MAPGFAAGLAARVAMLRLAERLPGGRLVASEFQGDAAPEVGPGVAAVDREGFVELGQRLLHLAFLQPAPAFGHVVIGVGDELDVEHRPPHHVSEHHAERAEPPEAGHFRSRHHRDGDLGDLLAAELDAHPRVLALGHQIARLGADLRQGPLQPFGQIDRHLLGRLSGLLRVRAARSAISAHSPLPAGCLAGSGAAPPAWRGALRTARRRRRCVFFSLPSRSAIPSSVRAQYAPGRSPPPRAWGASGLAPRRLGGHITGMPLHRERVDPIRTPAQLELCHRRWLLPDDVGRAVLLPQAARLWRGLLDLGVLDGSSEAQLDRLSLPAAGEPDQNDLPAAASAGALLAGAGAATAVSQVVFPEEGRRDPYQEEEP